jgi:hypothetical protein
LSNESENEKIQDNLNEDVVTQDKIGAQMMPEEEVENGYDADKGGEEPATTELGLPQQEEKESGERKEEVQIANNDYEAKLLPDNEEEEEKEEQLLTATTKKPASLKRKPSSSPSKQLGRRRIQQQQRLQKEPSLTDVSRQLDKQSSQIDKILSMLLPIQRQIKGTTTSAARQPQLIKQLQSQTKQLQRQLYQIQKSVQKDKKRVKKKK